MPVRGADASGAELRRVRWSGGKVDYANLRSANLSDVTVTGCEFGLAGATISGEQLLRLAPTFAAHLGVRIAP